MGTVFQFVGRTDLSQDQLREALENATRVLHQADSMFSLYKPESPLSKLARGELSVSECPPVVSDIWDQCEVWNQVTNGWFSPFTPQNTFDPSGLVKTWAAEKAAQGLEAQGLTDFALNAGGDIRLSSEISVGAVKQIAISRPVSIASEGAGVLTVVNLNGTAFKAVATSGTAERGEHIWNPKQGQTYSNELAQVTVVARDIVTADVWATALFASGQQWLELAEEYNRANEGKKLAVLAVDPKGQLSATRNFASLLNPV